MLIWQDCKNTGKYERSTLLEGKKKKKRKQSKNHEDLTLTQKVGEEYSNFARGLCADIVSGKQSIKIDATRNYKFL